MVVSSNLLAMNAQRQFNINTKSKQKSTEKLSSGYRINRSADDAAGLAISEKMRRQIRGLKQASENVQDGISLLQVADGALNEVHDMLQRINELSVKAANGTNTDDDRAAINMEITAIKKEIDRIGETTSFNERLIFKGNGFELPEMDIEYPRSISEDALHMEAIYDGSGEDWIALDHGNYCYLSVDGDNKDFLVENYEKYSAMHFVGTNSTYQLSNSIIDLLNCANGSSVTIDSDVVWEHPLNSTGPTSLFAYEGVIYLKHSNLVQIGRVSVDNNSRVILSGDLEIGPGYEGDGAYLIINNGTLESKSNVTVHIGNDNTALRLHGDINLRNVNLDIDIPQGFINSDFNYTPGTIHTDGIVSISGRSAKYLDNRIAVEGGQLTCPEELIDNGLVSYNPDDFTLRTKDGIATVTSKSWEPYLFPDSLSIQAGAEAGNQIIIDLEEMNTRVLGINGLNCLTASSAGDAIEKTANAIEYISDMRSKFGAYQNRLEHTLNNLNNVIENTTAAESRIRDTDMAKEMEQLSLKNILEQAGISMMAQANQSNQNVLQILQ